MINDTKMRLFLAAALSLMAQFACLCSSVAISDMCLANLNVSPFGYLMEFNKRNCLISLILRAVSGFYGQLSKACVYSLISR